MNWAPNPGPQTRFLRTGVREVLYGGEVGGGKTDALIMDPMSLAEFENQRLERGEINDGESSAWCIHFRRVMPNLLQTIVRSRLLYSAVEPSHKWNENDHMFTFRSGLRIQYAHMETKTAYLNYLGPSYTRIAFDELTEFEREQYQFMGTRLRAADRYLKPFLALRSATNPIGRGLDWVRKRFISPTGTADGVIPPETIMRKKVVLKSGEVRWRERMFIPAGLGDNPYLNDGEYEAELMDKPAHVRKALLEGDWWAVAGAFFGDLWDPTIHVVPNREPGVGTYRFRSCDYGYAAKSSVTWWEMDFDGCMTAYHNLTCRKHTGKMLAHRIREIEEHYGDWNATDGRSMLSGPLDRQCWAQNGTTGPTIAEEMMREGVNWRPSDKNRLSMANQMRQRLMARVDKDKKKPLIRWMKRCQGPVSTIPNLPTDPNDPEDVDTQADDHNYDDAGYACLDRPIAPTKADAQNDDWLDELAEKREVKLKSSRIGGIAYGGWSQSHD